MVDMSSVVALLCAAIGVVVGVPPASVESVRGACSWSAELLPLPDNAFSGRVTGGGGDWLVGVADDQGVLWRDGRLVVAGRAFGQPTELLAVNGKGVAVGDVTGTDGRQQAVRYAGGYEYLPGSIALDVNQNGDAVGYDHGTLVVWPAAGAARFPVMPTGSVALGRPQIDDDGTVVARVGWVEGQRLRTEVDAWAPDGARTSVPVGEVEDVRHGRVVGATAGAAVGWTGGRTRVYRGGTRAVAVNDAGLVVGAGPTGDPLLWNGSASIQLSAPVDYHPGAVTAVNDQEAGGFVSPVDDLGAAPVRWLCR